MPRPVVERADPIEQQHDDAGQEEESVVVHEEQQVLDVVAAGAEVQDAITQRDQRQEDEHHFRDVLEQRAAEDCVSAMILLHASRSRGSYLFEKPMSSGSSPRCRGRP